MPPGEFVLDTFAVLAYLDNEPGATRVHDLLEAAERGDVSLRLSGINAGEVAYILERRHGVSDATEALAALFRAPIIVEDASWNRILAAAHIKARHAMSYADAFAAALAQERGATLVTGDHEFEAITPRTAIEWLDR